MTVESDHNQVMHDLVALLLMLVSRLFFTISET